MRKACQWSAGIKSVDLRNQEVWVFEKQKLQTKHSSQNLDGEFFLKVILYGLVWSITNISRKMSSLREKLGTPTRGRGKRYPKHGYFYPKGSYRNQATGRNLSFGLITGQIMYHQQKLPTLKKATSTLKHQLVNSSQRIKHGILTNLLHQQGMSRLGKFK